jgi:hydroxymethylglutaryl-CoA reductase (NADPH)
VGVTKVAIADQDIPLEKVKILLADGSVLDPTAVSKANPITFPLRAVLDIQAERDELPLGKHNLQVHFEAKPFGKLKLKVDGSIEQKDEDAIVIPRDNLDDYNPEAIQARQKFVEEHSNVQVETHQALFL